MTPLFAEPKNLCTGRKVQPAAYQPNQSIRSSRRLLQPYTRSQLASNEDRFVRAKSWKA